MLEGRLHHADRRRSARYRDLVLITKLIRLEYEHLAGRVGGGAAPPSLPDSPPALGADSPADWARAWGAGPMYELHAAFIRYRTRRDRLARWRLGRGRARAAAEAERRLNRIFSGLEISRRERDPDEWTLEVVHRRVLGLRPQGQSAKQPVAEAAGRLKEPPSSDVAA